MIINSSAKQAQTKKIFTSKFYASYFAMPKKFHDSLSKVLVTLFRPLLGPTFSNHINNTFKCQNDTALKK